MCSCRSPLRRACPPLPHVKKAFDLKWYKLSPPPALASPGPTTAAPSSDPRPTPNTPTHTLALHAISTSLPVSPIPVLPVPTAPAASHLQTPPLPLALGLPIAPFFHASCACASAFSAIGCSTPKRRNQAYNFLYETATPSSLLPYATASPIFRNRPSEAAPPPRRSCSGSQTSGPTP